MLSVTNGSGGAAENDTGKQVSFLTNYVRSIWRAGLSFNLNDSDAGDRQMQNVFVPTTPNPTSGFLLFVPREDVIMLDMSVEDAAKLVISAGLVYPNGKDPTQPPEPSAIG